MKKIITTLATIIAATTGAQAAVFRMDVFGTISTEATNASTPSGLSGQGYVYTVLIDTSATITDQSATFGFYGSRCSNSSAVSAAIPSLGQPAGLLPTTTLRGSLARPPTTSVSGMAVWMEPVPRPSRVRIFHSRVAW